MTDTTTEDLATRAVEVSAKMAEAILNQFGALPPFGVAFFSQGHQAVAPFEDAKSEVPKTSTHGWICAQVFERLGTLIRQRADVLAVTTVMSNDGDERVFIQLELPDKLISLVFPVAKADGRYDLGDPSLFEQMIATPVLSSAG